MSLPKTLTISVTQKHIDEGKKKDCNKCPIAIAVCEELTNLECDYDNVRVDTVTIGVKYPGHSWVEYDLPSSASEFVVNFDEGLFVAPFTFSTMFEA